MKIKVKKTAKKMKKSLSTLGKSGRAKKGKGFYSFNSK